MVLQLVPSVLLLQEAIFQKQAPHWLQHSQVVQQGVPLQLQLHVQPVSLMLHLVAKQHQCQLLVLSPAIVG